MNGVVAPADDTVLLSSCEYRNVAKLVFHAVSYLDAAWGLRHYLLIECSASGFQCIEYTPVPGPTDEDPILRRTELTPTNKPLETALAAHEKRLADARAGGANGIEVGNLPNEPLYHDATVIFESDARTLEEERQNATSVEGVEDPRKVKAQQLRAQVIEREIRELASGFLVALHDCHAHWIDAGNLPLSISKTGGAVEILDATGKRAIGAEFQHLKMRVAYELGGNFALDGYLDDGAFVVTTDTSSNPDGLHQRIERARADVIRRPRRYETIEERLKAIRSLLSAEGTHLRIQCALKTATRYRDVVLNHEKLAGIIATLPAADQEMIHARAVALPA